MLARVLPVVVFSLLLHSLVPSAASADETSAGDMSPADVRAELAREAASLARTRKELDDDSAAFGREYRQLARAERRVNAMESIWARECTWEEFVVDDGECEALAEELDALVDENKAWRARLDKRAADLQVSEYFHDQAVSAYGQRRRALLGEVT